MLFPTLIKMFHKIKVQTDLQPACMGILVGSFMQKLELAVNIRKIYVKNNTFSYLRLFVYHRKGNKMFVTTKLRT